MVDDPAEVDRVRIVDHVLFGCPVDADVCNSVGLKIRAIRLEALGLRRTG